MSFSSFSDFVHMGGQGPFVWSAYGLTVVVLVYNLVWPVVLARRHAERVRRQHPTEAR
ncbi:MAG: heme exporter protein CcmD [Pseudomonadales bacterium]|nr:heme exporter protein CcmD [Pseudomonadales bacterium]